MRRNTIAVATALSLGGAAQAAQPPVRGYNGMVATSERRASEVGVDILKHGGNAIDAAVAVGYALAVVHPCCGNLGALLNDTDIARSAVVGAGLMFIDAQWAHMREEESDFFPLAERLLKPHDWRQIEDNLERRHDPVFGNRVEAMFKTLSERLLAWEAEDEATTSVQRGG